MAFRNYIRNINIESLHWKSFCACSITGTVIGAYYGHKSYDDGRPSNQSFIDYNLHIIGGSFIELTCGSFVGMISPLIVPATTISLISYPFLKNKKY
jgi:hypothetical protein